MAVDVIAERAVYHDIEASGILNPFNKNNKLLDKNKVQNILKKYGIFKNINNLELYQEAMIHESYTKAHISEICLRDNVTIVENPDGCVLLQNSSYERLEFLGDAILETIIVSYLFNRFPDQSEGFLASLKVSLVNRNILARLAKHIGLDEFIIMSKTLDDLQHARQDIKILCDVFEAFIAAICIDFNSDRISSSFLSGMGYQVAELFVINLIEDESSRIDITQFILNDANYKDQLVKYMKRTRQTTQPLEFKVVKAEGMGSHKEITINVIMRNGTTIEVLGRGISNTHKLAEQNASKDALEKLGIL